MTGRQGTQPSSLRTGTGCTPTEPQLLLELGRIEDSMGSRLEGIDKRLETIEQSLTAFGRSLSTLSANAFALHGGPHSGKFSKPASTKRGVPEAADVIHLPNLVMREKHQPILAKYMVMLIVMCFAHDYPQLKSAWIPESQRGTMDTITEKLGGVSGFSLLYFSKSREDNRSKWNSKMAKLWSWMVGSCIVAVILTSVRKDFDNHASRAPAWMRSFGGVRQGTEIVAPIVQCLEQHNIVPLAKEGSKRTKSSQSEVTSVLDTDPLRGCREQAVDCIRSAILRLLSDGRMKSRQQIFRKFLFVIEAIGEHQSIEEAKEAGFDIVMRDPDCSEELEMPPVILPDTLWDIPKTATGSPINPNVANENLRRMKKLESTFSCMNGVLKYAKAVERSSADVRDSDSYPEVMQQNLTMKFTEPLNLHRIAASILVDEFMLKDLSALLSCSSLSLRAIHITALALRAMICNAVGDNTEVMEMSALGDVTVELLDRIDCDDLATVAMGTRSDGQKRKKDSLKLVKMRNEKRRMSWNSYKDEANSRRTASEAAASESGTNVNGSAAQDFAAIGNAETDMSFLDG